VILFHLLSLSFNDISNWLGGHVSHTLSPCQLLSPT